MFGAEVMHIYIYIDIYHSTLTRWKPRLAKLYRLCRVQTDPRQVKAEAWLCKKFVVLLKRKKQRGQVPRNENFRDLLQFIPGQDRSCLFC